MDSDSPIASPASVRISGVVHTDAADTSNGDFTIDPTIKLTAPNGGETCIVGESYNITWTSQNPDENVKIELNRKFPSNDWEVIGPSHAPTMALNPGRLVDLQRPMQAYA